MLVKVIVGNYELYLDSDNFYFLKETISNFNNKYIKISNFHDYDNSDKYKCILYSYLGGCSEMFKGILKVSDIDFYKYMGDEFLSNFLRTILKYQDEAIKKFIINDNLIYIKLFYIIKREPKIEDYIIAIDNNKTEIIEYLCNRYDIKSSQLLCHAIKSKNKSMINYFIDIFGDLYKNDPKILVSAIEIKDEQLIKILLENNYKISDECSNMAAKTGDLSLIIFLRKNGIYWNRSFVEIICKYGYLDCLLYYKKKEKRLCFTDNCVYNAVKHGHLECLKILFTNLPFITDDFMERIMQIAVENNHLDCLKFLYKNTFPITKELAIIAAKQNNLIILDYLTRKHCPKSNKVVFISAINNHLDCLIYAHKHNYPCDKHAKSYSKFYEATDSYKYLLENNCLCE